MGGGGARPTPGETPKNGEKVPFLGKFSSWGGASRPLRPLPAYGPVMYAPIVFFLNESYR